MNLYNFSAQHISGELIPMTNYKGKVVMIVNTATECGFTPQYDALQDLYEKYSKEGLEILDFPCNQFGNQARGTDQEMAAFCNARFGITFSRFSKVEVNGANAIPLYKYLIQEKGFAGFDPENEFTPFLESMLGRMNPHYQNEPEIKWNFTKFIIDRSGQVAARFEPTDDIAMVEEKIKELLA